MVGLKFVKMDFYCISLHPLESDHGGIEIDDSASIWYNLDALESDHGGIEI